MRTWMKNTAKATLLAGGLFLAASGVASAAPAPLPVPVPANLQSVTGALGGVDALHLPLAGNAEQQRSLPGLPELPLGSAATGHLLDTVKLPMQPLGGKVLGTSLNNSQERSLVPNGGLPVDGLLGKVTQTGGQSQLPVLGQQANVLHNTSALPSLDSLGNIVRH